MSLEVSFSDHSNVRPASTKPVDKKRTERLAPSKGQKDSVRLSNRAVALQSLTQPQRLDKAAIERAKKLVADPNYPSSEQQEQLARKLLRSVAAA